MIKETVKLDKKKVGIVVLTVFCLTFLVYKFNLPIPFRYEIKGTSGGYIYKIDRFTGKTWVVTPAGEKEIRKYQEPSSKWTPRPNPTPAPFPLYDLEIKNVDSTWYNKNNWQLYGSIENKNPTLTVEDIKIAVEFTKQRYGEVVDTQYIDTRLEIPPSATRSFLLNPLISPLLKGTSWYYTCKIYSAKTADSTPASTYGVETRKTVPNPTTMSDEEIDSVLERLQERPQ